MSSINVFTFTGHAGRDPEVRYFESGTTVANFTVAVAGRSRDDEPLWMNVEIWGKQAQIAADYVRKGSLVGITGSVKQDSWTDRTTGEKRTKLVVNCQNLTLMGGKRDGEGQGQPADGWGGEPSEEEVPF
jgi:single-strand DNA-binding protein